MKVAVVLYPGCIFFELALALEFVSEKYDVDVLTLDGKPIKLNTKFEVSNCISYKKATATDYTAVLVPGGNAESVAENTELDEFLRSADAQKIIIGAICFGPVLLAKAGVLKGRKISHGLQTEQKNHLKELLSGIDLVEDPVTNDGHFLTAKPWAYIDFATEFANRLGVLENKALPFWRNYYRGYPEGRIRPLALAIIRNSKGQFLFHEGKDSVKGETFYRPLGGGIEFGETAISALQREIKEELSLESSISDLIGFFENIFVYEGRRGHEFIVIHSAKFLDEAAYQKPSLDIFESGRVMGKAVWRSLDEIRLQGARIYPLGLEEKLSALK